MKTHKNLKKYLKPTQSSLIVKSEISMIRSVMMESEVNIRQKIYSLDPILKIFSESLDLVILTVSLADSSETLEVQDSVLNIQPKDEIFSMR